ncbi:MAG: choice-of-anchor D domain-containing protein [Acidobacteria bacterium]|nr:choice-of-anchor D domain-containing protein [Acidobacteriota bacterium]
MNPAMQFFPRVALLLFLSALPLVSASAQKLECKPCSNHFGKVQIGNSSQRSIQLSNVGKRSLKIIAISIKGKGFSLGKFPVPMNLGAGRSISLPATFKPKVVGKSTGTITLSTNGTNAKLLIDLSGVGFTQSQAHLSVTPTSLDFGNVNVGSSASLSLTLSATGATVTVSAIQSDNSEFTLPGLNLPLTVAVGQNVPVTVKFKPSIGGTSSGTLTIASNADNSPVTVSVTGSGITGGSHSADLTWNASNDPVIGYNVYRGGTKGGPYSQINGVLDSSLDYTDSTVKGGATYYYVVKAVASDDVESAPSNEVKVSIPSP